MEDVRRPPVGKRSFRRAFVGSSFMNRIHQAIIAFFSHRARRVVSAAVVLNVASLTLASISPGGAIADSRIAKILPKITERVTERTLSNGMRVLFYRRGSAPVFSAVVAVRVGGIDEQQGSTGISHLLEHMAFKGTPEIGTKDYAREQPLLEKQEQLRETARSRALTPEEQAELEKVESALAALWLPQQLDEELDRRGVVGLNATTSKELTSYFLSLPRGAFSYWCWLESDRILRPVMRLFYQERDVVLEERRMRYENDPEGKLYEEILATAFTRHPYRQPVIGYEADLKRLRASELAAFHRNFYVASRMSLAIVGDVDPDRDLPVVERYFGRIPNRKVKESPRVQEPPQTEERRLSLRLKAAPRLAVAYHKPAYPHPDDPPLSVLEEVLAGSSLSPMYQELVKKRGVATSVDVSEGPGSLDPNLILFDVGSRSNIGNRPNLAAFDDVIASTLRDGVEPHAVELAKRSIARDFLDNLRSSSSIAGTLASSMTLYGDWQVMFRWFEETMAVKPEDVNRVARSYLQPANRTVATIEPEGAP